MTDLHSRWAETTWEQLVRSRPRRNRGRGLGLLMAFACLAGLAVLGIALRDRIARLPLVTIHAIEVSGNRSIPTSEIFDLLDLRAEDPWWKYKPSDIQERAIRDARIRTLSVRYVWFHRLCVDVVEREASLAVLGGMAGAITDDGWFLREPPEGDGADLPIVRPAPGSLPMPGSRVDRKTAIVARLVGELRTKRPTLWRDLSEIDLAGADARAYLRSRRGVILFTPGVHEELWNSLPAVLDDLESNGRGDVVLDLRFRNRVVVHLPEAVPADSVSAGTPRERI